MIDRRNRLVPGTPLPCCALVQVRGDWEWMVQGFRFRSEEGAHLGET